MDSLDGSGYRVGSDGVLPALEAASEDDDFTQSRCPNCNALVSLDAAFCSHCRYDFVIGRVVTTTTEAAVRRPASTMAASLPAKSSGRTEKRCGDVQVCEAQWDKTEAGLRLGFWAGSIWLGATLWTVVVLVGTLLVVFASGIFLATAAGAARAATETASRGGGNHLLIAGAWAVWLQGTLLGLLGSLILSALGWIYTAKDELLLPALGCLFFSILIGAAALATNGTAAVVLLMLAPLAQLGSLVLGTIGGFLCMSVPMDKARRWVCTASLCPLAAVISALAASLYGVWRPHDSGGLISALSLPFLFQLFAHACLVTFLREVAGACQETELRRELLVYLFAHGAAMACLFSLVFGPVYSWFSFTPAFVVGLAVINFFGFGCNVPLLKYVVRVHDALSAGSAAIVPSRTAQKSSASTGGGRISPAIAIVVVAAVLFVGVAHLVGRFGQDSENFPEAGGPTLSKSPDTSVAVHAQRRRDADESDEPPESRKPPANQSPAGKPEGSTVRGERTEKDHGTLPLSADGAAVHVPSTESPAASNSAPESNSRRTDFRTWTDHQGRQTQARYLGCKSGTVRLEKQNGQVLEVPLKRFSAADQAFVRGLIADEER